MARRGDPDEFERCTSELLGRLLHQDLGWEVTQNRIQSPGTQFGKDIQLAWIADNREYRWHVECKSHRNGSLRKEEVMPKLFDAWRSEHQIDVWCLALANIEPGQAIDEFFAAIPVMLDLPFRISVLSPAEHDLPGLFATHNDLFERVYPGSPRMTLSAATRRARIEAFSRFLMEESRRAVEPRDGRWTLVTPEAPERMGVLPDQAGDAVAYLRGFVGCEWDAIAYEWAVPRLRAEDPMLALAGDTTEGVTFGWCIGPAGEGKTTAARRVAWTLATIDADRCVLWGEAEFDALDIPLAWIEALDPATRVVLFVDGTRQLNGVRELQAEGRRFKAEGRHIVCILVDRGVGFARSAVRRQIGRGRANPRRLNMPSLGEAEVSALLDRLEARGILRLPKDDANARLLEISERKPRYEDASWLLPTLMEITDPDNRGFDEILADLLNQVAETDAAALSLLLATALSHAAGTGLPPRVAEDVVGGEEYGAAVEVLHSELLRQTHSDPNRRIPTATLLTYSGLVAETFVRLAWGSSTRRSSLEATCRSLVESAGQAPLGTRIARREFDLLNRIAIFLLSDLEAFELCALWLDEWVQLDDPPVNFVALQRLGDCLLAWTKHEVKERPESDLVAELATKAGAAFTETLGVAERVLAEHAPRPPEFESRDLGHEQRTTFHSWAVLEGVVGTHFKKDSALMQSAFLSILGMGPGVDGARSVGNLALNLIELNRSTEAAIAASAEGEIGGDRQIFRRLQHLLRDAEVEIPSNGLAQLGKLITDLTIETLLPGLDPENWPHTDEERRRRLLLAIPTIRKMLPAKDALDTLAAECEARPDDH